ncbi:MAG: site-specific integrase [Pseudolabrys sp.]|nr:site-specific integrase [Pseudolabrys sp.]
MAIRKRAWTTKKGKHEAWIVDYADQGGNRRHKTFPRKRDAEEYAAATRVQIGEGTHVADSASRYVKDAGDLWLASARAAKLEQSTLDQYEQHLRLHILPFIGREKLSQLTVPLVRAFQDRLDSEGRSSAMIRAIIGSLGAMLGDAQERGLVVRNAVRELRGRRRRGSSTQDRHKKRLKVGVDIPTPEEIRAIIAHATPRWRLVLMGAVFTGLRASELRGLRWDDVDLRKCELHVRQRADRYNRIGPPKSAAGDRVIPLPPTVVKELSEWKLICPKSDGKIALVFPNGAGNVESHVNIVQRGLVPAMLAAGIIKPVLDEKGVAMRDEDGKPLVGPKYGGLHVLRHFFASWCINRKEDGGQGLPPKVVQERLGHSSITMTMDTYGHLFPRGDDGSELAAAEKLLLG